jgi:threonine dehydratase
MTKPISLSQIDKARSQIDPVFLDTPILRHDALDAALGCACVLKIETLNPIRSFKGRGTEALMASLDPAPTHVVATSTGNFGQGLARAATRRGIGVTIFSPAGANPQKLAAMRRLGADVRVVTRGDDGKQLARDAARQMNALFIEDGAHPEIAAGAGTMAQELTRQVVALDAVLVQIGDGALITGIGAWIKATWPGVRIIGVTAEKAPSMAASVARGRPVSIPSETIADGIAIHTPIASAVLEVAAVVDEILAVGDDVMLDAMRLLLGEAGIVAEPAGAASVAALMSHRDKFAGQTVAVIVTGSNVRPELLVEMAARPVRAPLPDRDESANSANNA